MQDHDLRNDHASLTRRGQLIAAAEALVVWVQERRATWADSPLPAAAAGQGAFDVPANATTRFDAPAFEAPAPAFAGSAYPEPAPPAPAPYYEPPPVFERPAAPIRPAYEAPPTYEPPPAPYEPKPPAYEPPAPAYEPPAPAYEPPPPPAYEPPAPAYEPPPPAPAYEAPSRYELPMPAPSAYNPVAPAPAAHTPPVAAPASPYSPASRYAQTASYAEPHVPPAVAPPPPPTPIRLEPPKPAIQVQEYVPPVQAEVEPPPPVERPEPRERYRETASEMIAPVARWGVRLGVAAAILTALLVGAAQVRPYLASLSAPKMGTVVIESSPTGSDVSIDGKPSGTTPFSTDVTAGRHVLEFQRRNLTRTIEVDVSAGKTTTSKLDWTAKPLGRLVVESDPTGAKVTIDGKLRGTTPLTVADVSVGSHEVRIDSEKGSVRRTVEVTSERETSISETIFSGFLKVFAPFEVSVSEGARGLRLEGGNQLMLPPGVHELRFENKDLAFRDTKRVEIEPGKTSSITLLPGGSRLTVTATAPAEVIVDGQKVGDTPLTDYAIALGTRDILVKGANGERRFLQTVTTKPVRLEVDFSKP